MGLGLYPVTDMSTKAFQGMGQAAQSYGAMGQNRETRTVVRGSKGAGGALGAAGGGAIAGASTGAMIGGPYGAVIGGVGGALVGAASYLF